MPAEVIAIPHPEAFGRVTVRPYNPGVGVPYDVSFDGELLAITHADVVHQEGRQEYGSSGQIFVPAVIKQVLLLIFGQRTEGILTELKESLGKEQSLRFEVENLARDKMKAYDKEIFELNKTVTNLNRLLVEGKVSLEQLTNKAQAAETLLATQREITHDAKVNEGNVLADLDKIKRYIGEKLFREALSSPTEEIPF